MKDVNNEGDNFLARSEPLLFTTLPSSPGYVSSFVLIRATEYRIVSTSCLRRRDTIGDYRVSKKLDSIDYNLEGKMARNTKGN